LRRFVAAFPILATPYIIADIEPLLADTHASRNSARSVNYIRALRH